MGGREGELETTPGRPDVPCEAPSAPPAPPIAGIIGLQMAAPPVVPVSGRGNEILTVPKHALSRREIGDTYSWLTLHTVLICAACLCMIWFLSEQRQTMTFMHEKMRSQIPTIIAPATETAASKVPKSPSLMAFWERMHGAKFITNTNVWPVGAIMAQGTQMIHDERSLVMQDDCNFVLYRNSRALWASNTDRRGEPRHCEATFAFDESRSELRVEVCWDHDRHRDCRIIAAKPISTLDALLSARLVLKSCQLELVVGENTRSSFLSMCG